MPTFERPVDNVYEEDTFRENEIGLTHQSTNAHIRLKDDGSIEIVGDHGLAIIMNATTRSITMMADKVRFMTKDDGLRWNSFVFNDKAVNTSEPVFLTIDPDDQFSKYKGAEEYLYDEPDEDDTGKWPNVQVDDPETGGQITYEQYYKKYQKLPNFRGLT